MGVGSLRNATPALVSGTPKAKIEIRKSVLKVLVLIAFKKHAFSPA